MSRSVFSDKRGIAAVECALTGTLLLIIVGGLADFPLAFWTHSLIETGVANGATYAFQQGQADLTQGQQVSASSIQAVVQNAINLKNVTVTVTGPALECMSVDQTMSPPSATLTVAQAGSACPNGSFPGTYVSITASYVYDPMMPFYSQMATTNMTETANVRLY